MDMIASVIYANTSYLLVKNFKNNQEVIVQSHNPIYFSPGNCVRIKYDGKITATVPPRITAALIQEIECPN